MRAAAAAPMSWAPSAQGLRQLVELFRATASANNSQHRQIQQQLSDFNAIPDYCLYLAYILNQLRTEEPHVRHLLKAFNAISRETPRTLEVRSL